ncbi:MAG: SDR family oxidoreductase [Syntrophomonadaceae bacterium]|nr:SDR family oxidoreductase [Syntrophomonadaceae bacterium]
MELNLRGKVVVITAGALGIGEAVALAFAKEGCKIAICDISSANLENACKEFEKSGYKLFTKVVDVSIYEEVQAFGDDVVKHYGKIDIWINNAGIQTQAFILDMEPADWRRVMQVNLDSAFWGIQVAGRCMRESGGGVILNTSSFGGKLSAAKRAPYTASKSGLNALVRIAAGELAPYNIRVNAIAPGTIHTAIQVPEQMKKAITRIAMQRVGTAEEVAQTYVFLASDAASYITGEIVYIDGGKVCIQDIDTAWEYAKNYSDPKNQ